MTTLAPGAAAATHFNRCAERLAALHATMPTNELVRNLQSQVGLIRAGGWVMRVTVDSGSDDDTAAEHRPRADPARICSPLTTYSHLAGCEITLYL